jgi:hypothetical protein
VWIEKHEQIGRGNDGHRIAVQIPEQIPFLRRALVALLDAQPKGIGAEVR